MRGALEAGRPPDPGPPREGEQEGRSQEGPQGAAVLEALIALVGGRVPPARHGPALRHRRRPGLANAELTPELALVLGRAAARVLAADRAASSAGTRAGRVPCSKAHWRPASRRPGARSSWSAWCRPRPWPSCPKPGECVGAVISASHNPFADNGIKLFAPGGRKLPDDVEEAIEAELERELAGDVGARPSGTGVGTVRAQSDGARGYVDHLVGLFGAARHPDRDGLALDCANGATSVVAPEVFDRLGPAWSCGPPRRMVATSTSTAVPHTRSRWPTPSRPAGSSSAWPSTATATDSSRWTTPEPSSTATTSSPSARST